MLDFYAVLGRIRDANVVALRNIGNAPTRVGVVPGAIAWDDCDPDMVVQIVRCAPEPQGGETAPSVAALEASAREVIADATAVMCATIDVLNALSTSGDIYDFMMRGQMFVGPAGACVGSELQFVVGVIR